jgi:hypothetical protein
LEKVVALVWIGCGCGVRAVYVEAPGVEPPMEDMPFVAPPFDRIVGLDVDWTEMGIKMSSCPEKERRVSHAMVATGALWDIRDLLSYRRPLYSHPLTTRG